MNLADIVNLGSEKKASDVHLTVGIPPTYRVYGELLTFGDKPLTPANTEDLVKQALSEDQYQIFLERGELDFSYSNPGVGRYRVNAYKQRGSYGMALRIIPMEIPSMEELGL
ncbi:MAG TPA: type IV pili twitching motility protein PilT, partial [Tissierellaceae bacterium]|nr:type IV pili twitching motility protein PilT [Tissierellaceae bacterium]